MRAFRRCFVIAALLAVTAPPALPAPEGDDRRAEILASMRAADSVHVTRFLFEGKRTKTDPEPRARIASSSAVDSAWTARFVGVLAGCKYIANGVCRVAWWTGPGTEQLLAHVEFASRTGRLGANLLFRERCATIRSGNVPFGVFEIEPGAAALLSLLKEALPGDSTLHRTALPPAVAVEPARPRGEPAPPKPSPSDGNPPFGEYVFTEELPEALTKVPPQYPDEARAKKIDGTVIVQALVGKDGLVHDARIVKSIPALDTAAIEAVRQWKFKPAMAKGEPVAVWVVVPVKFTLH